MSRSLSIHNLRATMSSRSTYRGGRNQWRRSFSDRPPYNNNRGGGHFVTGDSHFRSIRDSNLGFRQGNLYNQTPPPPFHQFRQPPLYSNRNPPFRQPPPFVQNQAVRPRPPKPLDYRSWEQAKAAPPPDSERFVVLSYNILADYLAISHRSKLYYHIPHYILDWQRRKKSILFEIGLWSADIMCLQEVDRFQDLEEELRVRGYSGIWKMRTGYAIDGCAIFWRTSRFKLLFEESIEYNKLGLRDNVAQICVLQLVGQKHTKNTAAPPTSSSPHNKVVVCNIHVLYNPKRGEIKLGQVRTLLDRAHAVSKIWDDAPVVLCGDFNCTPKSPLYNFISEKKLDLSGVDRDKVSGQVSAEIRASKPYNPNPRAQTADGSMQTPSVVGGVSVGVQSIDPLSNVQKNNKDGNAELCPFGNKLSPSQSTETVLGGSDKACIDMQGGNDGGALIDEVTKESKQNVGKGDTGSAFSIPIDSLKESLSYPQSKVRFPTNEGEINVEIQEISTNEGKSNAEIQEISTNEGEINVEIQEISTSPQSHPENKSDLNEMGQGEKANATSFFNHGSISEQSESNFNKENESTSIEDSTSPLVSTDRPEMITASNAEISPTELSSLTCSNAIEVSVESFEKFSSVSGADDKEGTSSTTYQNEVSSASTSIDILVTDQLENLFLSNLDESRVEVGSIDEDDNTFLSALRDTKDAFPPDLDQFVRSNLDPSHGELVDENLDDLYPSLDSEAVDVEKTAYDPSLWTPMEIATATGNGDCTYLEHPLQLTSTYAEVEDGSGTRDTNGEPLVTSYHRRFLGTVDYIWRSEGLQTVRVLAPIPKHAMQWTPGFPTKKWGSDHIALASEMAFTKP